MEPLNYTQIKSEVIKRYTESKSFLSQLDMWSYIIAPTHVSFKTSQTGFQYIKGDSNNQITEEKVSSGRLAIIIKIPEMKVDNFILDKIEIIQDIDIKINELKYVCTNFQINSAFSTKNAWNQKQVKIFDIKAQDRKLVFKVLTSESEWIELVSNI